MRGLQVRGAQLPLRREGGAVRGPLQQPGERRRQEEAEHLRRPGGRPRHRAEVPQVRPRSDELRRHPAAERGRGPDRVLHVSQVQIQGERELVVTMGDLSDQATTSDSSPHIKLWVGNLPHKLTEFQLLKMLEKFGTVSQFDFLYHITDAGKRLPRGYAFVTFTSQKSAENAIKVLNKTEVLGREIIVRLANPKTDPDGSTRKIIPAALKAGSKTSLSDSEKANKIRQLEAKLKGMDSSSRNTDFKVTPAPSTTSRYKPYPNPKSKSQN